MKISVVAGNPKPQSRTLHAGCMLAEHLTGNKPSNILDLAELGNGILEAAGKTLTEAMEGVLLSDLIIFASPTYKASYTGLLKLFLDFLPAHSLRGKLAVPLMMGAAPHHALAAEVFLKPVLVELGAQCPTPGLYLLDSRYEERDAFKGWLEQSRAAISLFDKEATS